MPMYDYRCQDCKRRFDIYISYAEYGIKPIQCPHCNSSHVMRRIGRIRFARSEENRFESMADPSALEGLEDDPKSLGRMMRKMSKEVGEDMGPEFDEVIGRLESGQSPESIEKEMPELGNEMGGGMPGMGGSDLGDDF